MLSLLIHLGNKLSPMVWLLAANAILLHVAILLHIHVMLSVSIVNDAQHPGIQAVRPKARVVYNTCVHTLLLHGSADCRDFSATHTLLHCFHCVTVVELTPAT